MIREPESEVNTLNPKNGKSSSSSPRYFQRLAFEIAGLDPSTFIDGNDYFFLNPTAKYNLIEYISHHSEDLRGSEFVRLCEVPIDFLVVWKSVKSSIEMPVGLTLSACIKYTLDLVSETPEFVSYSSLMEQVSKVKGLHFKRKMFYLTGSKKRPKMHITVDELIDGCTERLTFRTNLELKDSLSTKSEFLSMSASNLGAICLIKGLVDSGLSGEPEFDEWGENTYIKFLSSLSKRINDISTDYEMYVKHFREEESSKKNGKNPWGVS